MSIDAARRRYASLNFLLWLPTGLYLVPLVLLMLDRGLSVPTIALVTAVYGLTVALLELPTGGLTDAIGRRPVLVASAVAGAGGLLLLGLADTVALFLASAVLRGVARALSTGPLEAWYVDTVHAQADRDVDLTTGLARGEVAGSLALAVGTLAGGLLPLALGDTGALPALAVPVLTAAGVEALRASRARRVVAGLQVSARDRVLARVLLAAGGAGVALGAIELLTPAWLAELTSGPTAAATYAVVAATGFGADAVGGMIAGWTVRTCGSHARAAATGAVVSALSMLGLAGCALLRGPGAMTLAGLAYCLMFLGLGAAFPAQAKLLHDRVEATERATVLSVQSLLMQVVVATGLPLIGWQATRHGVEAGYLIGAAVLFASAALFVRLPGAAPHGAAGTAPSMGEYADERRVP
ncbi:MFS transporter [Verrucosispora sioxanthis]|uniref:MFS transporter n=1 Tax=Verrucosispora sioxanthis TaxID=2499994 RepID=UPI001C10042E|nr:MFS transporter [Verrucosispora sioxanthis]